MESIDVELGHVRSEDGASTSIDEEDGASTSIDEEDGASTSIDKKDGASTSIDKKDVRPPLIDSINEMFKNLEPRRTSECCIYRVRGSLRKLNEAAYTPRVISIGPFHRGKKEVQTMEKYKERYLYDFLQRNDKIRLEDMVTSINEMEERVRRCYAEIIELSSDELVKMILLDGCFIIEFFLRWCGEGPDDNNDDISYKPCFRTDMLCDLILLENQLPFFVLEKLYNLLVFSGSSGRPIPESASFLKIAWYHFSYFNKQRISLREGQEVKHFTDLVRTFHLPSSLTTSLPPEGDQEESHYSLSAMELHEAGVKFKVNSSSQCLFDIQFTNNGELQIPHLFIEDCTESLFRNIMALEQCYYSDQTYICEYINLMDTLINTAKDVELLVRKGIIGNWLGGNDAVAILFNNLCLEIEIDSTGWGYILKVGNDLTNYYNDPWHNWKATLKRDYFSSPWRIASTVAAIVLLVLTFMQTVNSFISL